MNTDILDFMRNWGVCNQWPDCNVGGPKHKMHQKDCPRGHGLLRGISNEERAAAARKFVGEEMAASAASNAADENAEARLLNDMCKRDARYYQETLRDVIEVPFIVGAARIVVTWEDGRVSDSGE